MPVPNEWQRWSQGDFQVTTDPAVLDLRAVHGFLSTTSWAAGLSSAALAHAIDHSLCFSLFKAETQIGFARVITDYVTYAYLCDVYIAETFRNRGVGRWMMRCVLDHPVLKQLKRIALLTHEAEAFYRGIGFADIKRGSVYLEFLRPQ